MKERLIFLKEIRTDSGAEYWFQTGGGNKYVIVRDARDVWWFRDSHGVDLLSLAERMADITRDLEKQKGE